MRSLPGGRHAPSASQVVHATAAELGSFKKFILRGNVVDLAVGVVIGAAFGGVVQAVVRDLITPILGAFGGQPDFAGFTVTVLGARLLVGDFLNALLSFLLIAAVVYFLVVLPVTKLMDRYRPDPSPARSTHCPNSLGSTTSTLRRSPPCAAQRCPRR